MFPYESDVTTMAAAFWECFRTVWLKFTTVSRKPAASSFRVEEHSQNECRTFFRRVGMFVLRYTLYHISDGSYLQSFPSLETPAYAELQVRFTYLDKIIQ
jgi:hypothetical protein